MSALIFQKAFVIGACNKVILTCSEILSSITTSADHLIVTINRSAIYISSFEVSGSTVELTHASRVDQATPVKVS